MHAGFCSSSYGAPRLSFATSKSAVYPPCTSLRRKGRFWSFCRNVKSATYGDSMEGDVPSPVVPAICFCLMAVPSSFFPVIPHVRSMLSPVLLGIPAGFLLARRIFAMTTSFLPRYEPSSALPAHTKLERASEVQTQHDVQPCVRSAQVARVLAPLELPARHVEPCLGADRRSFDYRVDLVKRRWQIVRNFKHVDCFSRRATELPGMQTFS